MKTKSLNPTIIDSFESSQTIETSGNGRGSPMQEASNKMQKELDSRPHPEAPH